MQRSAVFQRVAYRTGVAGWRNRGSWLLAALVLAGVAGGYAALQARERVEVAGRQSTGPGPDCADLVMAYVAWGEPDAGRRAYDCLGGPVAAAYTETEWRRQFSGNSQHREGATLSRVGEHATADGGRLIFYSLDRRDGSVGYVVYLGSRGKVLRVE